MRKSLKITILTLFAILSYNTNKAQNTFPTIYNAIKEAKAALIQKDTIGTIANLSLAVDRGLFDLSVLNSNAQFSELLHTSPGNLVYKNLLANRQRLGKPSSLQIHTEDIELFWKVYDQRHETKDLERLLLNDYIGKGTIGLQTFFQIRLGGSTKKLAEEIKKNEILYDNIRSTSLKFESFIPEFNKVARKMKRTYPWSVFPPVYFMIGRFSNVGTPDGNAGMLIGAEHLCRTNVVDSAFENDDFLNVLFPQRLTVPIITHELFHMQQNNEGQTTLLDFSISEGAADFLTYLTSGKYTDPNVYIYGQQNEIALKKDFISEMHTDNLENWLFNGLNKQTGRPANMGYFIGFKICEAFYKTQTNKSKAIHAILNIKNFKDFAYNSGYFTP